MEKLQTFTALTAGSIAMERKLVGYSCMVPLWFWCLDCFNGLDQSYKPRRLNRKNKKISAFKLFELLECVHYVSNLLVCLRFLLPWHLKCAHPLDLLVQKQANILSCYLFGKFCGIDRKMFPFFFGSLQDYKPEEDPAMFKSAKTGRGPLAASWMVGLFLHFGQKMKTVPMAFTVCPAHHQQHDAEAHPNSFTSMCLWKLCTRCQTQCVLW